MTVKIRKGNSLYLLEERGLIDTSSTAQAWTITLDDYILIRRNIEFLVKKELFFSTQQALDRRNEAIDRIRRIINKQEISINSYQEIIDKLTYKGLVETLPDGSNVALADFTVITSTSYNFILLELSRLVDIEPVVEQKSDRESIGANARRTFWPIEQA